MSVAAAIGRKLTWEDIRDLPETAGRTEIHDGDLVLSPTPSTHHQEIATKLAAQVLPFVEERGLGKFYASPVHCILDEHVNVEPDLCFVTKDRLSIIETNLLRGAPDLVIEILSPSNRSHDTLVKFRYYERFGVREYWLADPVDSTVAVFGLADDRFELLGRHGRGQLVETRVLAGLALDPARIF